MYQLILLANTEELVCLKYDSVVKANIAKDVYMMTGNYKTGAVQRLCPECGEIALSQDQDTCSFCDEGEGSVRG